MKIWAYEACRLFRDKLAKEDDEQKFDSLLKGVLQADWNSGAFESIANSYYVTLGDSSSVGGSVMPAFGRKLGYLSPSEWEPLGNLILNYIAVYDLLMSLVSHIWILECGKIWISNFEYYVIMFFYIFFSAKKNYKKS